MEWFHSEDKNPAVPQASRIAVRVSTNLECTETLLARLDRSLLKKSLFSSRRTKNPMPPEMIKNAMVRLTSGSPLKSMRLCAYKQNPALQKALIE
jgi:hypothetical protein